MDTAAALVAQTQGQGQRAKHPQVTAGIDPTGVAAGPAQRPHRRVHRLAFGDAAQVESHPGAQFVQLRASDVPAVRAAAQTDVKQAAAGPVQRLGGAQSPLPGRPQPQGAAGREPLEAADIAVGIEARQRGLHCGDRGKAGGQGRCGGGYRLGPEWVGDDPDLHQGA